MAIATAMLTDVCHEPADEPPTPTVESTFDEVVEWLEWFLKKNYRLSPDKLAGLVEKLACSGKILLSYNETQWRKDTKPNPRIGSAIYNALHGMNHFQRTTSI